MRAKRWVRYLAIALVVVFIAGMTVLGGQWFGKPSNRNPVAIAAIVPLSGEQAALGKRILQSVQLEVDIANQEGGINGHPIQLLAYDDASSPDVARQRAQEIVGSPALIVVGHWSSVASGAAGPVYKAGRIPALTPTAFSDDVTKDNPYYFRAVYTGTSQASTIATYIQKELRQSTATLIYTADNLGRSYREGFKSGFRASGRLKQSLIYNRKANDREQQVQKIVTAITADRTPGIIYLGMLDDPARELIVALRRGGVKAPIFVSGGAGREEFAKSFQDYDEEKQRPGFFTDGVYAASPLIFDSANFDAQEFAAAFQQRSGNYPDWPPAKFYDATKLAVSVLRAVSLENTSQSRSQDRQRIRDKLATINQPENAFRGISGLIYFDADRSNSFQPMRVGQFFHRRLISAPIQYNPIANPSLVNLKQELKAGNILQLNDQYVWLQRVVYTGIDIKS